MAIRLSTRLLEFVQAIKALSGYALSMNAMLPD
jgi:hypothetical protein